MSWFEFKTDTRALVPLLTRIADALDRIAPERDEAPVAIEPEDAVQYVDEEKMQRAEAIEEMGSEAQRLLEYAKEHPEEFPEAGL